MNMSARTYRIYLGLGAVLLVMPLIVDRLLSGEMPEILLLAFIAAGSVLLVAGILLYQRNTPSVADERFLLHRLKASRFGLVMGLVAILALFAYHALMDDTLPWDLVAVAAAMAVGKLAAMAYFKVNG